MNIFFDLDGTLLDVSKKYYFSHILAAKKSKIKPLSFKRYWTLKRNRIPENQIIRLSSTSKLFKRYEEDRIKLLESQDIIKKDRLFPGISELLRKLEKVHKLYIITLRRNRLRLKAQLDKLGIRIYFKKILSAPPSRDNILAKLSLVKKNDLDKNGILIGDTEVDILVAKKLRFKSVVVFSGIRSKKYLKKFQPDFLVSNVQSFFADKLSGEPYIIE